MKCFERRDLLLRGQVGEWAEPVFGHEPARQLITDAAPLLPPTASEPQFARLAAVQASYALRMDFDSIGDLIARHGLRL